MEDRQNDKAKRRNLLLMGAAVLFVAVVVAVCLLLRPKTGTGGSFVISIQNGETMTVKADASQTVVIRDGMFVDSETGEGHENVIRIEDGQAWMEHANCPHGECMKQGVLSAQAVSSRPLGAWIICMPHGVTVEYREDGR